MRNCTLWAVFSVSFILCVVIGGTSTAFAVDFIVVTLNGTTIPTGLCPAPDDNATLCVKFPANFNGLSFTPVTGACTTKATCARVANSMNDGAGDTLQLANTRITNNTGADTTFTLVFSQENLATPPGGTPWYNTYLSGEFGAVALNKIVSAKTFVKWGAGTYQQAGNTLTYTVSCLPDTSCLTVFSKKTGAQKAVGNSARGIKGELVITLKVNSYVELETSSGDHGHKIIAATTPPDGTTVVGENAIEGDCPSCTPSSQLSVICSTTYSTAKMFSCPSCVTEDGQVAANAKVKLFASTNRENLAHDMARGEGEYLASLAILFHIPAREQLGFFSSAQEEYRTLNGQDDRAVEQVVAALQERAKTYHASTVGY